MFTQIYIISFTARRHDLLFALYISLLMFLVLVPQKNIEKVVRKLPQLHDEEYWSKNLAGTDMKEYLVIPGE